MFVYLDDQSIFIPIDVALNEGKLFKCNIM